MDRGKIVDRLVADMTGIPEVAGLMEAMRSGHLCVEGEVPGGRSLKGDEKEFDEPVGNWDGLAYLQRGWKMEMRIAEQFARLVRGSSRTDWKPSSAGIRTSLRPEQNRAVEKGLEVGGLFFLTGGPGTGKTHTVAELVKLSGFAEKDVVATAPTGKATAELRRRLGGVRATTLHKLLTIKSPEDPFFSVVTLDAKMVVVDECSMIDAGMWGALLAAIPEGRPLILVGDKDQLPPVEAGTVYEELCSWVAKYLPERHAHLDQCVRTDAGSIVADRARAVREGRMIPLKPLEQFRPEDFKDLYRGNEFAILSCLKEGYHGVRAINARMAEAVGTVSRVPVMATRSDYEYGIRNGETGIFEGPEKGPDTGPDLGGGGTLRFRERVLPASLFPHVELAYAVSVHKSQGSEYERVVLVVPKGAEVFGREILYTGITRARSAVEVYGDEATVGCCLKKRSKKLSGLVRRLSAVPC
ncbi:MAG: AAA family ATPase [Simkaniaceae bacterium]|nr:AAA family ATPase [Simkaniaceae bacterium]